MVVMITVSSSLNSPQTRIEAQSSARKWLQENKINGTVSCNYGNEHFCDVIPADARPAILLYCNQNSCHVEQ